MQTTPYSTHTRRAPAARACARALAPQRPPSCHAHAPRAPRLAASSRCCARAAARRVHLFAPLTSDRSAQQREHLPGAAETSTDFLSFFIHYACLRLLACLRASCIHATPSNLTARNKPAPASQRHTAFGFENEFNSRSTWLRSTPLLRHAPLQHARQEDGAPSAARLVDGAPLRLGRGDPHAAR